MKVQYGLAVLFAGALALAVTGNAQARGGGSGGGGGGSGGGTVTSGGGGGDATPVPLQMLEPSFTIEQEVFHNISIGTGALDGANQPVITLTTAPPGMVITNAVVTQARHGDPWRVEVFTNNWAPTIDEVGKTLPIVFTATDPVTGATATQTVSVNVIDAPGPATGLTAVSDGNEVTLNWQTTDGHGVAPLTFRVDGCYRTSASAPAGSCTLVTLTTAATITNTGFSAVVPAIHQATVAGEESLPWDSLQVTVIDGIGAASEPVSIVPTLATAAAQP